MWKHPYRKLFSVKKNYEQSITDDLTQIFNRRYFVEQSRQYFLQAKRENKEVALIVIDLDDFKMLNDSFGHACGDRALTTVSALLKHMCKRPLDFVARKGGDEFVIFLYSSDENFITKLCDSLMQEVSRLQFDVDETVDYLTLSIGIATSKQLQEGEGIDELVHYADMAAYQSKSSGKNTYTFYQPQS